MLAGGYYKIPKSGCQLLFSQNFFHCLSAATDICWAIKMTSSLLTIEIHVHVINNCNNKIRGSGVERDVKHSSLPGLMRQFFG